MADPISIAMGLAQFAPQVIKWISGSDKAAEAASKVVEIAEAVTGKQGPEAVEALKADPALVLQFRQAVMANETELDKAYLADRQDARRRDVALAQAGRYNWRGDLLALLAVGGLVLCVWFVARDTEMPERAVNAIMFVAGVLAAAVRDVYNFEFGSSRGSKSKDDVIARFK
ncbi:hypothetical protein [uncultured Limnobacter sp.]|uniref:hypothetical protein n=1 Tax=uncultured Limnobacter sp. TaxID=199681 RepID=UPI0030FB508A